MLTNAVGGQGEGSKEQRWGGVEEGACRVNQMVRKDPPEKLTFEEMPEGGEGMHHADHPKEDHSRQRPCGRGTWRRVVERRAEEKQFGWGLQVFVKTLAFTRSLWGKLVEHLSRDMVINLFPTGLYVNQMFVQRIQLIIRYEDPG